MGVIEIEFGAGQHITSAAEQMVEEVVANGCAVEGVFNGIRLRAIPGVAVGDIVKFYSDESRHQAEEYRNSPAAKEAARRAEAERADRVARSDAALANAPAMSLRDEEGWAKTVAANQDVYGSAIVRYAERWARVMEAEMSGGRKLSQCARDASHLADSEGITGFMYGAAASILSQVWQHGEDLRRWHNLETQIKDEGERANESGGVLNPALIRIGE